MYEYAVKDAENTVLKFETSETAFYPTDTSTLLIESCQNSVKTPVKMLDLGCGIGINGLVLAKLGLCQGPLYASDIGEETVSLVKENAQRLNVPVEVRCGSLFEPWAGEKFDVIIDDISGLSDEVAKISPWFPPGVNCKAGRDGTRWTVEILKQSPEYLREGGRIFFPVLSLSNQEKILRIAREYFFDVVQLAEKEWFLPKETAEKIDQIMPLIEDGTIKCQSKFGAWIWSTKIYMASKR